MNLYLIGYRCSGKTSVGKALAARMGWQFFDCDLELVKSAGRSIKQIVACRGWDVFRDMERDVLVRVCRMDARVVATGGGVVLNAENVRDMKRTGVLIWLKAEPQTLNRRILQDGNTEDFRPSFSRKTGAAEIEEVLGQRRPLYEGAMDFSIQTDDADVDAICNRIYEAAKELNFER